MASSIIERIQKLHAQAESAHSIGNIEEASAFAAKVQEMLLKHKLETAILETSETMEEVEDVWSSAEDFGFRKGARYCTWFSALVHGIARANGCEVLGTTGSTNTRIIGAPSDRKIVQYLTSLMIQESNRLLKKAQRDAKSMGFPFTRRDTNSWRVGFARGIGTRLHQQRKDFLDRNPHALIPLNRYKSDVDAIRNRARTSSATKGNYSDSFYAGRSAAANANIHSGIGGSAVGRRGIGSGS